MGTMYSGNLDVDFQNDTVDIAKHDGSTKGLKVGGTLVTSTAAELNKLDGVASVASEIDQRVINFSVTLGTADDQHIAIPFTGNVISILSVIDGALATADETLTFKNHAGTSMTNGVITITQSGSADGDVDNCAPSANNSFTTGEKMTVSIGGENGNAVTCNISVLVSIT